MEAGIIRYYIPKLEEVIRVNYEKVQVYANEKLSLELPSNFLENALTQARNGIKDMTLFLRARYRAWA